MPKPQSTYIDESYGEARKRQQNDIYLTHLYKCLNDILHGSILKGSFGIVMVVSKKIRINNIRHIFAIA